MLFMKPISEITYDDVVTFCEAGNSESFVLEYKGKFEFKNSNLAFAKIISAFANTYGGLLIVGVAAPKGSPKPPFIGIDFDPAKKYEEQLEAIAVSHIREPVFPLIKVCEKNGKAFILVRVSESDLTPHRIEDNKHVYVRTSQSSRPNEEADWETIEWLHARRRKSIEFREGLDSLTERNFLEACTLKKIDTKDKGPYFALLSLKLIPTFPGTPLISYTALKDIGSEIASHPDRANSSYPRNFHDPDPIHGGVHKLTVLSENENEPNHGKRFWYTLLHSSGIFLHKEDIGFADKEQGIKNVKFRWVAKRIFQYLDSARKYYNHLAYYGSLQFRAHLELELGTLVQEPGEFGRLLKIPSSELIIQRNFSALDLNEKLLAMVLPITHELAWGMGIDSLSKSAIERVLKEEIPRL